MQSLSAFVESLHLGEVSVAGSALLFVLFIGRDLWRRYPAFFAYWMFDLAVFVGSSVASLRFEDYAQWLALSMAVRWILYFLMVIELVDRVLYDHPGLAKLGRRAIQILLPLSIAMAVLLLKLDGSSGPSRTELMFEIERVVTGCLLIFLLSIVSLLWFFPVRLNANTKAYCLGFTTLFLVKAAAFFLLNTRGITFLQSAQPFQNAGVLVCQVFWLFALTRKGETRSPAFTRGWTDEDQLQILATLHSLEKQISHSNGR